MNEQRSDVDRAALEQILAQLDPYIIAQAKWVAWMVNHMHGGIVDWEDLAQAARVYIWRYAEQRPGTSPQFLFTIGRLKMYGEPQRGSSVDRAHPGKRQRHYTRTDLEEADAGLYSPLTSLTNEEKEALLQSSLAQARLTQDERGEHLLILALRHFAKVTGKDDLYADAHAQWKEWWRKIRERGYPM
jgi:DNA-directed RNA polymerase specialized sigma24 family protein